MHLFMSQSRCYMHLISWHWYLIVPPFVSFLPPQLVTRKLLWLQEIIYIYIYTQLLYNNLIYNFMQLQLFARM